MGGQWDRHVGSGPLVAGASRHCCALSLPVALGLLFSRHTLLTTSNASTPSIPPSTARPLLYADLLRTLKERSEANRDARKKALEDKYCMRQVGAGSGYGIAEHVYCFASRLRMHLLTYICWCLHTNAPRTGPCLLFTYMSCFSCARRRSWA